MPLASNLVPNGTNGFFDVFVKDLAPEASITSQPADPSTLPASFVFTASTVFPLARFECQLDGGEFAACTTPRMHTGLSDGAHTFEVRAVDTSGFVDSTPATVTWTVTHLATVLALGWPGLTLLALAVAAAGALLARRGMA